MTDLNSGFLKDGEMIAALSSSFSDIEIIALRDTHFLAGASRYGRRWLLKGLRKEYAACSLPQQQLLKEFEILSSLSHPGIVNFAGMEEVEGYGRCIVMEWIEGPTLEEALHAGQLSRKDRHRILFEIVEAVAYLHSKGVVHRDLKPSNIMLRQNGGKAVVIDFGLADTDAYTVLKIPAGTPGYISERQQQATKPYTGDDVYAIGVVMQTLYPEYRSIIRHCTDNADKCYRDASVLLRVLRYRSHRNRRMAVILLSATVISAIFLLVNHNHNLRLSVSELEEQVDSLILDHRQDQHEQKLLSDSIEILSNRLNREAAFRIEGEHHEAFMADTKRKLKEELQKAYVQYLSSKTHSAIKEAFDGELLIKGLADTKSRLITDMPSLSEEDKMEIEHAYAIYYGDIITLYYNHNKK